MRTSLWKAGLFALVLSGALAQGATVADDPRVQQLEQRVQVLEKALKNMEASGSVFKIARAALGTPG